MEPKDVPDWRMYFAAAVAELNGRPVEPGQIMVHLPPMTVPRLGELSFPPVSPYRLALSIAIRASQDAKSLWREVKFDTQPGISSKVIDFKTLPALYDYLEHGMIAVTFSYQALETYANGVIEECMPEGKTFELQRRKGSETHDAAGVQRWASTPEKLATVLPALTGVKLDKGGTLWQAFQALDNARDALMHLKTANTFRAAKEEDNVFCQLLNAEPTTHPATALKMMRHFTQGDELTWLKHAEERLAAVR
jgi:hypothetical protein